MLLYTSSTSLVQPRLSKLVYTVRLQETRCPAGARSAFQKDAAPACCQNMISQKDMQALTFYVRDGLTMNTASRELFEKALPGKPALVGDSLPNARDCI